MEDYGMTETFYDKNSRQIEITIDIDWPPKVIAKHNGKQIGHLEFDDYYESGTAILIHVEVDEKYQKSGIATQMMKELVEITKEFYVPNFEWSRSTGHDYYYSQEGATYIESCIRNNILSDSNIAPY